MLYIDTNKDVCKVDQYGVLAISAPVSARVQDKTGAGIRVERGYAIIDADNGVMIGNDAMFLGRIFVDGDVGIDEKIKIENHILVFKDGILTGFYEEK